MPEATKNVLPGIFAHYKITSFSPNTNPSNYLFTGEYTITQTFIHILPPSRRPPSLPKTKKKKFLKKSLRIQEVPFTSMENQVNFVSLCSVFFRLLNSSLSRELSRIVFTPVCPQFANHQ